LLGCAVFDPSEKNISPVTPGGRSGCRGLGFFHAASRNLCTRLNCLRASAKPAQNS